MANTYTLTPTLTLLLDEINQWSAGTIIINNGSSVILNLSQLKFDINGIDSDNRIIKAEVTWPTGNTDGYYTKLTKINVNKWLENIGPKHIVFDESELVNDKNKIISINLYDIADNKYQLQIPILIESRSILGMNITVEPSFSVYNNNIATTILDIRPESVISSFPDYKTPVLSILT